KVMGILNITPDSFYDGGRYTDPRAALNRVKEMVDEGADIIDIGGASTRPGAATMDPVEESARLTPVVSTVREHFPELIISIDTYNASVAETMITNFDIDMINDISAGDMDPQMIPLIAKLNVPYIIMHMKGVPGDMQDHPTYENITDEIVQYFSEKKSILHKKGVTDVLIDPGFGFGKTLDQNYELLNQSFAFQMFELPVVAGISRKSMIYNLLGISSEEALNGTTAAHMILLEKGVNILRVHDVREAREAITIFLKTLKESN
ncbi:MAG: dihydropteroate synthase, partial [Bacteroidales bacterium]|nr:dihydropteroate synthase [Bacteroidales bacterium]